MFERLTDTAAEALRTAERESDAACRGAVGSEHLLLGLFQVRAVASIVLKQSGGDLERCRAHLAKSTGGAHVAIARQLRKALRKSLGDGTPRYSTNLARVLQLAEEAARELAHPKVGTEHLLWALVEHADGPTRSYFESIDLSPEQARRQILEMLRVAQTALKDQGGGKPRGKRKRSPLLDTFTTDLVRRARKGRLQRLVRRTAESQRLHEAMLRLVARNALVVGENGCGKTALVETFAKEIALRGAPEPLLRKRVLQLDPLLLVAGTRYRGQFEERIVNLLAEIRQAGDVILFIDDLHLLALPKYNDNDEDEAGAAGVSNLMHLLAPALDRFEVQMIATCAAASEAKVAVQFPVLATAFHRIVLGPPGRDAVLMILNKKRPEYEAHHRLRIEPGALATVLAAAEASLGKASAGCEETLVVAALKMLDRAAAEAVLDRELHDKERTTLDAPAVRELLMLADAKPPILATAGRTDPHV